MYWIALLPTREEERTAWSWRALQFTPRVAQVDEAILLEIAGSERLWGGRGRLMRSLLKDGAPLGPVQWGHGATSSVALALLRLKLRKEAPPARVPQDFSLDLLTAAAEHVGTLDRTGCRTWGGLRTLPRGGVSRRFGAALLDALDAAYGERPERFDWLQLPESFDMKYELMSLATTAPELMWSAQRLLSQLQVWLQARHRGVLALELEWTLDLRRLNGVKLPSHEQLVVRTAQPTQDIAHLRRLVGEHLSRASLSAPVNHLRLRSLETVPWGGVNTSLLPEDNLKGERLHQLIERLSVRLGEGNVVVPCALEDHRPERMQAWVVARHAPHPNPLPRGAREQDSTHARGAREQDSTHARGAREQDSTHARGAREQDQIHASRSSLPLPSGERAGVRGMHDAIYPPWLLPIPQELDVRNDVPHYHGPLRRLTRLFRIETGWWEEGEPALRDYFIARSEKAGLVWIYRERPLARSLENAKSFRWYLQGLYA